MKKMCSNTTLFQFPTSQTAETFKAHMSLHNPASNLLFLTVNITRITRVEIDTLKAAAEMKSLLNLKDSHMKRTITSLTTFMFSSKKETMMKMSCKLKNKKKDRRKTTSMKKIRMLSLTIHHLTLLRDKGLIKDLKM